MKKLLPVLLLSLLPVACGPQNTPATQSALPGLKVSWELVRNYSQGNSSVFDARFLLENTGERPITASGWRLYWNMSPRTLLPDKNTGPATVNHLNGDFYYLEPNKDFNLQPGETAEVGFSGNFFMIKETDAPLGLYLANGSTPDSTSVLKDYTVLPFNRNEQVARGTTDQQPVPTAQTYFEQYSQIEELPLQNLRPLTPAPAKWQYGQGIFSFSDALVLAAPEAFASELQMLKAGLQENGISAAAGQNPAVKLVRHEGLPAEGYQLQVNSKGVTISASSSAGAFYGVQSLLALLANSRHTTGELAVRHMIIEDRPAFGYRGMHLDVARNFHSKATVEKLLDAMATYKLNTLQICLTEDEGWRLEIEELPELTEVGSQRGHVQGSYSPHLMPAYGSGAQPGQMSGSGFYTRQEFKDILQYAQKRHIKVIPTINVPGHSRAAIQAMEYRYRKLMAAGEEEAASKYRLTDPQDTSRYISAQMFNDNTICICRPSAIRFVKTVIDDVIEIYKEAGVPLEMLHTGGDEVPAGAWAGSPVCQQMMQEKAPADSYRNLQAWFFGKVHGLLQERGLTTGGWEEVAMQYKADGGWQPNAAFANGTVVPYVWNSLWGQQDLGYRLANAGYPVVLCNVTNFYFDLAYNKDPQEPGLYWGGFVDTRKAFEFVPMDLFKSMRTDPMGKPFVMADFDGQERLAPEAQKNILGLQGQLWSETVKSGEMLEYYYLPKLLGLAERAWQGQQTYMAVANSKQRQQKTAEAWNEFANRTGQYELPRLAELHGGYNYRVAPPGARVQNGQLQARVLYPGLQVRYTTNGSEPSASSSLYQSPVKVTGGTIKLKAFDSKGRGSATVEVAVAGVQ